MPASKTPSLHRYAYIDSLRGIAILLVLLAHVTLYPIAGLPSMIASFAGIDVGPRGVQLFYLLSAFTLCLSFSKRQHLEKHPVRNFYIRRFFRIAPLFYLAILYYLWQGNVVQHVPYSVANIVTTIVFLNGFFPYWINNIVTGGWSIAVEMTFYAVFPILFFFIKSARWAIIFVLLSMMSMQILRLFLLGLPVVQHTPDLQTYTFQFFPSQFPIFILGMSLFVFGKIGHVQQKKLVTQLLLPLAGIIIFFQVFFGAKLIAGHYLYGLLFGILLYGLSVYPISVFVNPVTEYIGKISFSLYLVHIGVAFWLERMHLFDITTNPLLNFALRFILLFGVSTFFASMLYATVERGGIRLGKMIIDRLEHAETASIAEQEGKIL